MDEYQEELIQGTGKIFLIDDEEIIRIMGKLILEDMMGYEVITFENPMEAIEAFKEQHKEVDNLRVPMNPFLPK